MSAFDHNKWAVLDCPGLAAAIHKQGECIASPRTLMDAQKIASHYIREQMGSPLAPTVTLVTNDDEWDGLGMKWQTSDKKVHYMRIVPIYDGVSNE